MISLISIKFLILLPIFDDLKAQNQDQFGYPGGDCYSLWSECSKEFPISSSSSCCKQRDFYYCQIKMIEFKEVFRNCFEEERNAKLAFISLTCDHFTCELLPWVISIFIISFLFGFSIGIIIVFVRLFKSLANEFSPKA